MSMQLRNPANIGICPIGSVLLWLKDFLNTPSLPYGWQECDGSAITYGVYSGQNTPNLTGRFPLLYTESGLTGGSTTHTHAYSGTTSGNNTSANPSTGISPISVAADRHTHTYSGTTLEGNNTPPYYSFVPIMRIA